MVTMDGVIARMEKAHRSFWFRLKNPLQCVCKKTKSQTEIKVKFAPNPTIYA
jgi:hypothetical protein